MGGLGGFFQPRGSSSVSEAHVENGVIGPIEALEAYSAEHPESLEELKSWHWKKFETLYTAFVRRKAIEEALMTKNAMISGLWSNPNFDDNKQTRKKALLDIERSYEESIRMIYNQYSSEESKFDQDLKDPLFAAMKLSD